LDLPDLYLLSARYRALGERILKLSLLEKKKISVINKNKWISA